MVCSLIPASCWICLPTMKTRLTGRKTFWNNTVKVIAYLSTPLSTLKCPLALKIIEEFETALQQLNVRVLEMPREALFLTGNVFLQYKKNKGKKISALPFFLLALMPPYQNSN